MLSRRTIKRNMERMRRSGAGHAKQVAGVAARRRVAWLVSSGERCSASGCGAPTMAAAGKGFVRTLCKRHWDQANRHGSNTLGTIPATLAKPIVAWAESWIRRNKSEPAVQVAVWEIVDLYSTAGRRFQKASAARYLRPDAKAWNVFSLHYRAGTPETRLLAHWLAVVIVLHLSTITDRSPTYRRMSVGKSILRVTHGGTTTEYVRGKPVVRRLPSRGLYLITVGRKLDEACGGLLPHLPEIIAAADAWAITHPRLAKSLAFLRAPTAPMRQYSSTGQTYWRSMRVEADGRTLMDAPRLWQNWNR